MTYPGTSYSSDIIFPRKHYYYDGMGNRVAVITDESTSGNEIKDYCWELGMPFEDCNECMENFNYFFEFFHYEAGGKLLAKRKNIDPFFGGESCEDATSNV